jgi:hypothetical protein
MSAGRHILESVETMLGEPNQYEILRIQASELHRERDLSKERSLRSMMKLWTEEQILNSLNAAGFAGIDVQCFWRNHNFAGFIALK